MSTESPKPQNAALPIVSAPSGWLRWLPGLLMLKNYQLAWLPKDIAAGLVLTTMLVPVGIAYAEASGVPGIYGLYATIVPLLAYALFGPSRILVLGPDSALAALILAVVLPLSGGDAMRAVILASMMAVVAGLTCIVAGLLRLGFITELLSKPIRYGYMNGIALTVLISQTPKLFGISVDGAVDIAREAADIILLEKSLMVLEEGVIEGRRTFSNMLKYIKMTASSNFGNVFSVLVASAFLPFLPMLPLHLLIQNLLYDVSQVAIPFDNVDDEQIQKPQRWNPADLGRFMLFFGPISSIFDILTFCLMWWVFHANVPEAQTLFQSGWFVVGLLSQTLIVHMIRTRRVPFIQSRAAWPLMLMTLVVMIVGIALPFSPLAGYLQLQALPLSYFPWLVAILVGYMTLTQWVKGFYSRRYGWQ